MALIKIPKEMGSTPGIVDNSNATAITIDSSENVTFAGAISVTGQTVISSDALVSTPSTYYDDIVVQNSASGTGAGMTVLVNATNGFGGLKFGDSTNSNQFGIGFDANANAGFLDVLGAQALTIDSNRNVGIGTGAASLGGGRRLTVAGGALAVTGQNTSHSASSMVLGQDSTAISQIRFYGANTSTAGILQFMGSSSDGNVGGERMRLTAAGDLYFAQTSGDAAHVGHIMQANGVIFHTADGAGPLRLRRLNSAGDIVQFNRDGTDVGSIGVYSSDRLFIGAGDTNITFKPSHDIFYPSTATGAARDNAIDLGDAGARFKDIYLSGGVNFSDANGGQTFSAGNAANTLSDYEVGTFTATLKGGSSGTLTATAAEYTKIGNTVHCRIAFINVNTTGYSGHLRVEGLPFPMGNSQLRNVCTPAMYRIGAFTADYVVGLIESSTHVNFYGVKSANTWNTVTHDAGGSRYLEFNVTYNTNA